MSTLTLILFASAVCLGSIGVLTASAYYLRRKWRARFRGGSRRYLLAAFVWATCLVVPVPVTGVLLQGTTPQAITVAAAIVSGYVVLLLGQHAPVIGPSLLEFERVRRAKSDNAEEAFS